MPFARTEVTLETQNEPYLSRLELTGVSDAEDPPECGVTVVYR